AAFLEPAQLKLYTMIWKRFVASQMTPALLDQTSVDSLVHGTDDSNYTFRSTASVMVFPGFTKVYDDGEKNKDDESSLPEGLTEKELLAVKEFNCEQKFSEPPPRYSEAALIKDLESNGIGRPSTYATILRTIQDREYVRRDQGKLVPTELGFSVNDFLTAKLPELFDIGFTAQMETQLDKVEEGEIPWTGMMADFYRTFAPWLKAAKESDAPPADDAAQVVALLKGIAFDPPQKSGRRLYDDAKFFNSVLEKYSSTGKLSSKQYQALLSMAGRYVDRLPRERLAALPDETRLELVKQRDEQLRKGRERAESSALAAQVDYAGLFNAFSRVTVAPPAAKGKVVYDDKKFFDSLKKQALSGKVLSAKQNAALARLAKKYRGEITDPQLVDSILGISPGDEAPEKAPEHQAPEETAALLQALSAVKTWEAPTKRGRFTVDDKKFFDSLNKQFKTKKVLSEKQTAALKKLAAKYGDK
ncbi:MAG: hypothetical protein IJU70_09855, partial [Lentisphaeria bacterium]|nr:hypothetical protein [Lentisphaeria bacterium]